MKLFWIQLRDAIVNFLVSPNLDQLFTNITLLTLPHHVLFITSSFGIRGKTN